MRLGFIALFEYFPNRDAIEWFVKKCWPHIRSEIPGVRLRLAGLGSDGPYVPIAPDIDGLGWITNPAKEICTWSAMVAPIRIGGGTRVKVAQAFSQKCPLVSTSLGAYGYAPVDGHNMYLADSAEAFSAACIRAIREPKNTADMAERAWHEFLEKWTWNAIYPAVWATAEDCLRKNMRD
jgi:glycosyltransferase involved in cell wall biosynthesis